MTQKKKVKGVSAKSAAKPLILKNPKVKKGLATLKTTEDVLDEKDFRSEMGKIKKQQDRLNKLLTDLEIIEHGKVKNAKRTKK